VVTNLAPDHLDRYDGVEAYYSDKARLFENATSQTRWVLNGDDPAVEALAGDAPGERFYFSLAGSPGTDAAVVDGTLLLRERVVGGAEGTGVPTHGGWTALLDQGDLPLLGRHNAANALAAALAAGLAGAPVASLGPGLRTFQPLPHRLELVGTAHGLRWVNDSKATNVAATVGALESLEGPLVLLLGGKDKGEVLEPLRKAVHEGVRGLVLYGEARGRMAGALEGLPNLHVVDGSFEEAVDVGLGLGREGDILLLSPACSSFDMFESYEARGRRFAALAKGEG
jgi:UDP-N-acetylmuramoylalanine--D-glutamate ligase